MTVREYIDYLRKLDQDADIWCVYDCGYSIFEPELHKANETDVQMFNGEKKEDLKVGDYFILAG